MAVHFPIRVQACLEASQTVCGKAKIITNGTAREVIASAVSKWSSLMAKPGAFAAFHNYEDENGDEQIKFIGIFSTKKKAEAAVEILKRMQGFADYPLGFSIDYHPFDRTGWSEGFVHIPSSDH